MRSVRLTAICVNIVAVSVAAALSAPAAAQGPRVTVAVFGDSVVEGRTLADPRRQSLSAQLESVLAARPELTRGGDGLLAASNLFWRFTHPVEAPRLPADGGWQTQGVGAKIGGRGPSGYSAATSSSSAYAIARVTGTQAVLLYTTSDRPSPFAVGTRDRVWKLDAYAPGPPHAASTVLGLPPGTRTLTVFGPGVGSLTFQGVIDRRPVRDARAQIEVSNLGHEAHGVWTDLEAAAPFSAVAEQRYDVSVFLWGYFAQVFTEAPGSPGDLGPIYERALRIRARVARLGGRHCLVASPTFVAAATAAARREFNAIDRRVARAEHCLYTAALTHLWSSAAAGRRAGLLELDDLHPTARGQRAIARILAPLVARLAAV